MRTEYQQMQDSSKFWLNMVIGLIVVALGFSFPMSSPIKWLEIVFKVFVFMSGLVFIQYYRIRYSASLVVGRTTRVFADIFCGILILYIFLEFLKWILSFFLNAAINIYMFFNLFHPMISSIILMIFVFIFGEGAIRLWRGMRLPALIRENVFRVITNNRNLPSWAYVLYEVMVPTIIYFSSFRMLIFLSDIAINMKR